MLWSISEFLRTHCPGSIQHPDGTLPAQAWDLLMYWIIVIVCFAIAIGAVGGYSKCPDQFTLEVLGWMLVMLVPCGSALISGAYLWSSAFSNPSIAHVCSLTSLFLLLSEANKFPQASSCTAQCCLSTSIVY